MKYIAAQGDLNIFLLEDGETIPSDVTEKKVTDGKHILAHSETGHHHYIEGNCARVYEVNELEAFVEVTQPKAEVIHLRSFDTHGPISLDKGNYKITRQREYTPDGWRRAQD